MKIYKKIILILTIIFIFFIIPFTLKVQANSDLIFTFENDIIYDDTNVKDFDQSFNTKKKATYTNNYPATFSFENDTIGSNPNNFTVIEQAGTSINVFDYLDGHKNIVEINDTHTSNYAYMYNEFNEQNNGSIELYSRLNTELRLNEILLQNETNKILGIRMLQNKFQYYDSSWNDLGLSASINKWYHIKIEFECTKSEYKGLSKYDWHCYINGKHFGNYDMAINTTINRIYFKSGISSYDCKIYIDAIGYSWHHNGLYNATYSFTNETNGTEGTDIKFISTSELSTCKIVSNDSNHRKVLYFGSNETNYADTETFSNQIISTYEFWIRFDSGFRFQILAMGTDVAIQTMFYDNKIYFYYGNGLGNSDFVMTSVISEHYSHIRIEFNCTSYTYNGYCNGKLIVNDVNFYRDFEIPYINYFRLSINTEDSYGYIDGIGYSWDTFYNIGDNLLPTEIYYEIGNNLIPTLDYTDLIEVDKYEFALKEINDLNDIGTSDFKEWNKIESGNGFVQYHQDCNQLGTDRTIAMSVDTTEDFAGLEKTDFNSTNERINITLEIIFDTFEPLGAGVCLHVNSSDNTNVINIDLIADGRMVYWNGIEYIELRDDISIYVYYRLNLYIDYFSDICIFKFSNSSDSNYPLWQTTTYIIPLIINNKIGLNGISFMAISSQNNDAILLLDYIGVYINGTSNCINELGYNVIYNNKYWNRMSHYLLTFNFSGYFLLFGAETEYNLYQPKSCNGFIIKDFQEYNKICLFENIANSSLPLTNSCIVFYFNSTKTNSNFKIHSLLIEGVKLIEGNNIYYINFKFQNVNITKNYFYVKNNKLKFNLDTNENNTEYLIGSFNIINVLSEGYSANFHSNIVGNAFTFLGFNNTDTSNTLIPFPYTESSTNSILPQERTIDKIYILITDSNKLMNGTTYGYITNLELKFIPDITITITTISLISLMIPLIVIFVPTLSIRTKYGKNSVIPIFLLMIIFLFATSLIPMWLFFIIMLSLSVFLLFKSKSD